MLACGNLYGRKFQAVVIHLFLSVTHLSDRMRCPVLFWPRVLAISILLPGAMALWAPLLSADEADLRQRFLEGVAKTAEKVKGMSLQVKCVHNTLRPGKDPYQSDEVRYTMQGPFVRKVTADSIQVKNREYAFNLQISDDSDKPVLAGLYQNGGPGDKLIRQEEESVRKVCLPTWYLFGMPLSEWLQRDDVKLESVTTVQVDGVEMVRVEFADPPPDLPNRHPIFESDQDLYIICDPENGWAMREKGAKFNYTEGGWRGTVLYHPRADGGFPVPYKTSLDFVNDNGEVDTGAERRFTTIHEISRKPIPEEEFYLSHYGIPEPKFETPVQKVIAMSTEGSRMWMLYAAIGFVSLLVVLFIRHRNSS